MVVQDVLQEGLPRRVKEKRRYPRGEASRERGHAAWRAGKGRAGRNGENRSGVWGGAAPKTFFSERGATGGLWAVGPQGHPGRWPERGGGPGMSSQGGREAQGLSVRQGGPPRRPPCCFIVELDLRIVTIPRL